MPKNTASWEIFRRRSLILRSSTVLSTSALESRPGQPTTVAKQNRKANEGWTPPPPTFCKNSLTIALVIRRNYARADKSLQTGLSFNVFP